MKFKIAGKCKKDEQVVSLDLVNKGDDEVMVVAVDANRNIIDGGGLCTFGKNGKVYMHAYVNPDLGFCRNSAGGIVVIQYTI